MHPSRRLRLLRRFLRAPDGATAVEFALVITPFLLLLFAIMELSIIFLISTSLDNAVASASRQIRTGSFQAGGGGKAGFQTVVCDRMPALPNPCTENLFVDVETFDSFSDLADDLGQKASSFNANATCFSPGNARDIVLVRVYYTWPLFAPTMSRAFANYGDKRMMMSTAVFRNEPFNDNPPVGAKC